MTAISKNKIYCLGAQYIRPDEVIHAAHQAHNNGYRHLDACSPFPVEELADAIGFKPTLDRIAFCCLIGGLVGCSGGYLLQYWTSVIDYPINVGGRPLNSWPAFIPICFELAVLCAALSCAISMFAFNGLPELYHPYFNAPEFQLASKDRFYLFILADDPLFDLQKTRALLEESGAETVFEVQP